MKTRLLTVVSVLANVALLVVAVRPGSGSGTRAAPGASASPSGGSPVSRVKTNLMRVELTETNATPPFHWRMVQSDDLRVFAENLRGIGCPRETIRAVIERELWEQLLPRRRALLEPFQRRYWEVAASGQSIDKAPEAKALRAAIDKLKEETVEKLDEIVAGKAPVKPEKRERPPLTDFLSDEKWDALQVLDKEFGQATAKLRPAKGGKMTPELLAQKKALQAQRDAAVRALMTPEEHAEYALRQSRYAATAQSSVGFEATESEARTVAAIYQQFEAADAKLDRKDPEAAAKKAQAAAVRKQREESLKQALGGERFAEFQQGMDGEFAEIHRITKRYELPRETASRAAETLKARDAALARLGTDKAMSAQEREERALAVNVEARSAMLGVLGERALRTYEKYRGPVIPPADEQSGQ